MALGPHLIKPSFLTRVSVEICECIIFQISSHSTFAEAPAARLHSFHREAREHIGDASLKAKGTGTGSNEARNARRFIRRWGLEWSVPFRSFKHIDAHNEEVIVYYISPLDFVTYLLEKAPEVLLGGHFNETDGKQQLESFWDNYEKIHPSHVLFQENHEHRSRSNTLCLSFHGDEGRGLKKGNTAILMMESNLGLETSDNYHSKRRLDQCQQCCLRQRCSKRFKVNSGYMTQQERSYDAVPASFETHNTKLNSFLTKYVLAALPNSLYKETNALEVVIQKICADFRLLFERGVVIRGQPWFAAVTGLKGDLKWYEKIACWNDASTNSLVLAWQCAMNVVQEPRKNHLKTFNTTLLGVLPSSTKDLGVKTALTYLRSPLMLENLR
jgi:hypothetical protein